MRTEIDRSWDFAIIVTEMDLRGIAKLIIQSYGEMQFVVNCNEGSKLNFQSLDQLFEYENNNFRKIESILMKLRQYKIDEEVYVHLRSSGTYSCQIDIEDTDDSRSFQVANELEKRLRECKPWYSPIVRFSFFTYSIIAIVSYYSISVWVELIRNGAISEKPFSLTGVYLVLPIAMGFIGAIVAISKAWDWLFPKVWFCIGRQKREYEKRKKARTVIFYGVLMSLGVSLVANWITS